MDHLKKLVTVADIYTLACGLKIETTSSRVFNDGKKLAAIKSGSDITTNRWEKAMIWFSENWPDETPWPEEIDRPLVSEPAE